MSQTNVDMVAVVGSSNVAAIGYLKESKELRVRFNNGQTYAYSDVGEELYKQFTLAESKGSFLQKNIRGRFQYKRVLI